MQESSKFELISEEYPLIYKRYTDGEIILVAINPTNSEKQIKIKDIDVKECIYSFNSTAEFEGEKLIVPAMSASYLKITC